jgi:hypothetical protein
MSKMANSRLALLAIVAVAAVAMVAVYMKGHRDGSVGRILQLSPEAQAAKAKISPVKPRENRDVYYPGAEALRPDEMRVVALGTGMLTIRPKQAAACFLAGSGRTTPYNWNLLI